MGAGQRTTAVPIPRLEKLIQSTGFFRNKARNIHACCQKLVEEHVGKVPAEMEKLVTLPGVGRKTANVVLGTVFGQEVLDGHLYAVGSLEHLAELTGRSIDVMTGRL